jgi:hypothetical protein
MSWTARLSGYELPNVINVEPSVQTLFAEHNYERDTPPIAEWGGFNAPALLIEGIAVEDTQFTDIENFLGTSPIVWINTPDSSNAITSSDSYVVENIGWAIEGGFSQAFFKYKILLVKATGGVSPPPQPSQALDQSAYLKGIMNQDLSQSARLQDVGGGPYYLQIVLGHGAGVTDPMYGAYYLYPKGTVVTVTVLENEEQWEWFILDNDGHVTDLSIDVTMNADHNLKCFWSGSGPE